MSISLGRVAWLLVPSAAVVQCRIATQGNFGRVKLVPCTCPAKLGTYTALNTVLTKLCHGSGEISSCSEKHIVF